MITRHDWAQARANPLKSSFSKKYEKENKNQKHKKQKFLRLWNCNSDTSLGPICSVGNVFAGWSFMNSSLVLFSPANKFSGWINYQVIIKMWIKWNETNVHFGLIILGQKQSLLCRMLLINAFNWLHSELVMYDSRIRFDNEKRLSLSSLNKIGILALKIDNFGPKFPTPNTLCSRFCHLYRVTTYLAPRVLSHM